MALIVVLTNISELASTSDYNYQVLVGDGTTSGSTMLESGKVLGHERKHGWYALLEKFMTKRKTEYNRDVELWKALQEAGKE